MANWAARTLFDLGYTNVYNLEGGIKAWKKSGLPVAGGKGSGCVDHFYQHRSTQRSIGIGNRMVFRLAHKVLENSLTAFSSACERLRLPINRIPLIFFEPRTVPAPIRPADDDGEREVVL